MRNNVKSFSLFIRPDPQSEQIAQRIREINNHAKSSLEVTKDGDLVIAIGGDGTFIDAVTSTGFSKSKIYAGLHTGTLGFLQNLSPADVYSLIESISSMQNINTRKLLVSSVTVNLINGNPLHFYSLNEVVIAGKNHSKIEFAEYIDDELLQNVTGDGIIIATNTGDTAYSMNTGGAIDFSEHFQLVCTLKSPIMNAAYERFISNPIICPIVSIVPKPSNNICIIIDGISKSIDSSQIKSIDVSMLDGSNYIHKYELQKYSKCTVIRKKILGYDS